MFSFFGRSAFIKELDSIISEINTNMENNYKDAAQASFKELEQRFRTLVEEEKLSKSQETEYYEKIADYREKLRDYSHRNQKPYWTRESYCGLKC